MYLDSLGNVIAEKSWLGHLAAGVPGSVAGLAAAHDSLGSLPWAQLIQPAIDLAKKGFPLTAKEASALNEKLDIFRQHNTRPGIWWSKDKWQAGDSITLPDLGLTLELIRDQGRRGFYEGPVADSLVAEMARGGGIITKEDLLAYQPVWRPAVAGHYRGCEVISMGPPSSGGIALLQLLKMIEPFPIREYGHNSARAVHLMAEAERRVYADRAAHLGDPDFWPVPQGQLLDSMYLQQRMTSFDPEKATESTDIFAGEFPQAEGSEETTHYSIVDAQGNAVAVTTTLNGGYGACVLVGGAGFFLNNEMDDFSAKPGVPNSYGLLGAEANAIEPGKRMLSSMTPAILAKDGKLLMVVGTPGGSTIITSVFQNIVNIVDFEMDMQASVAAPRFHHQWLPDEIFFEEGAFSPETRASLEAMGHHLQQRGPMGRVDAVRILPDGDLQPGADPRGDDWSSGY